MGFRLETTILSNLLTTWQALSLTASLVVFTSMLANLAPTLLWSLDMDGTNTLSPTSGQSPVVRITTQIKTEGPIVLLISSVGLGTRRTSIMPWLSTQQAEHVLDAEFFEKLTLY